MKYLITYGAANNTTEVEIRVPDYAQRSETAFDSWEGSADFYEQLYEAAGLTDDEITDYELIIYQKGLTR